MSNGNSNANVRSYRPLDIECDEITCAFSRMSIDLMMVIKGPFHIQQTLRICRSFLSFFNRNVESREGMEHGEGIIIINGQKRRTSRSKNWSKDTVTVIDLSSSREKPRHPPRSLFLPPSSSSCCVSTFVTSSLAHDAKSVPNDRTRDEPSSQNFD